MTSERCFPSKNLVLAYAQYPFRLPAYRTSHRLRYHPYPRYASPSQHDRFINTVDFPLPDPHSATELSSLSIVEEDSEIANLDEAISGGQIESRLPRARRLSALVIELAFAVGQKLATIRANGHKGA